MVTVTVMVTVAVTIIVTVRARLGVRVRGGRLIATHTRLQGKDVDK